MVMPKEALLPSSKSSSSKAVAQLESEVEELQRKLKEAEENIRMLQARAADFVERKQVEDSLRQSEKRLEMELADTKLLQGISSLLIHEESVEMLYAKITEAALTIMQSDFASMQMYYPERGTAGELRLLASCGLSQEGKEFWAWVGIDAGTTCAVAMRTGKRFIASDIQNCEFVVGTPDHAAFIQAGVLAAQSTPLYSRNGKLLGMISTHWTHHHTPSDRDLNLLDILARQAADLIERNIAAETLTEADQRKNEFLATLAHELRNPLSPIHNALSIMRAVPASDKVLELLAMMDRQVAHLVRLVDDLLDVSRLSQGKINLRKENITLQNAVNDAIEGSWQVIENNSHLLTLNLPEEPLWIYADLTRIAQIVTNLLNNAAKYTLHGGHITLSAYSDSGYAVLSVCDTGVGIPANMLPNVFDLFTQVDCNLERSKGGLGIGLALVKQLLGLHEGEITAYSAGLNQGSMFTIRLPLAVAEETTQTIARSVEDAENTADFAMPSRRVLVVDDNKPSAQTTVWLLELGGHQAKMVHDGAEALTAASAFHPEIILLDIGLPDMNGYEVCRELRKDSRFKHTLMIAQTGWGQERDRQLAKEAGFDHHLVKPVNFESLTRLLASIDSPRLGTIVAE